SLLILGVAVIGLNVHRLAPYVEDSFARCNMEADVHWTGFEGAIGLLMIVALVLCIRHHCPQGRTLQPGRSYRLLHSPPGRGLLRPYPGVQELRAAILHAEGEA